MTRLVGLVLFGAVLATASSAARSAELPADIPGAPSVDFGALCEVHGPGFKSVGGSDVCVRIGGSVAAETGFVAGADDFADRPGKRDDHRWKSRAEGEVELESRFETDFGTVRTFFAIEGVGLDDR